MKKVCNLDGLNLVDLNSKELQEIQGGFALELIALGGAYAPWGFDRGREIGRAIKMNLIKKN